MHPTAQSDEATVTVSPAMVLVVRSRGLSIWTGETPPPLELEGPELELLEALVSPLSAGLDHEISAVAARSGVATHRLVALADGLAERGLLLASDGSRSASSEWASPEHVASVPADLALVVETPLALRLTPDGFEALDHSGRVRTRLSGRELAAAIEFRVAGTTSQVFKRHQDLAGPLSLDEQEFEAMVRSLRGAGLLTPFDPNDAGGRENRDARFIYASYLRMSKATDEAVAAHDTEERDRQARTGVTRVRVTPLDHRAFPAPLSLGMVIAYARAHKGGALEDRYQFVPSWLSRPERLATVPPEPGIFLCSNYIWSHGHNLAMSAAVKAANPWNLTVHGGPDTPKYEGDVRQYLEQNPQVDIAVHGEGEVTFAELLEALVGAFDDGPPDLSRLHDVAGLSFRTGGRVVHTGPRERIADLDSIPSPFLEGLFDVHSRAGFTLAIIETNRGCPYGCTFCDWGSATLARIRKFDMGRVFAELEWCAENHVERIFVADANFGIFERDVDIAEKVASLKGEHGYPKLFSTNYAKNTTKHLRKIVETFGRAGILTQGLLSLQSMDAGTLKTIKRSNIKVEKYDELAREFRKAELPLFVDLMLGLPGATPTSFRYDLQQCIDREITAKIYPTELLVNSPMNDPAYRELHRIETGAPLGALVPSSREADGTTKRALLVASSTYTREEYAEMLDLRRAFTMAENFGVLRQISRFVRQATGITEVDFYDRLRLEARDRPDRSPALAFTLHVGPFLGIPPVSWAVLIDELRRYITAELGVVDDSALATALAVQHVLLPSRDRSFPITLHLAHDYGAWHRTMVELKDSGVQDWTDQVPPLGSFPPADFLVDDPFEVCGRGLGYAIEDNLHGSWELSSSVARAVSHEHQWDE